VRNLRSGEAAPAEPLPPFILKLLEAGGILGLLERGERLQG
jgi:hypothetical protein